ncbi:Hint domain-containing protein [Tateyamaria sp.]|uniref:Hint domain-containing protein n=1 Tax=Tateyamaria sp. TaxID=1929288 RepID=UPI003B2244D3
MPSTFKVISLGQQSKMDTTEGNYTAENAADLVGMSFGEAGDPLFNDVQTLSEVSASGGNRNAYDMNNNRSDDKFSIDGGSAQTFDATAVFNATLTYTDGTTANFTAVVFQDTDGNTYLAPEFSQNADQAALEAKPIQSMSLDSLAGNRYSGMTASREDSDFVTCFVSGTLIATVDGDLPIEALSVGTEVITQDGQPEPIRWIGGRTVRCHGSLIPVRIRANALGLGLPNRTLLVSKQHRIMVASPITKRMFGEDEVLVAAHKLVGLPGVELAVETGFVTYWHILCDRHEVIFANGAPVETLYLGTMTKVAMSDAAWSEVAALFPQLQTHAHRLVRMTPKGHAQSKLVARMIKNKRAALERIRLPRAS